MASAADSAALKKALQALIDPLSKVLEGTQDAKPTFDYKKFNDRKKLRGVVPLGAQLDRFIPFAGLSAPDSDMRVRAENVGIFLPGLNQEIWEDWTSSPVNHLSKFHLENAGGRWKFENPRNVNILEVANIVAKKSDDEEDDTPKEWKINAIPLVGEPKNGNKPEPMWFAAWQNLIPAVPTRIVECAEKKVIKFWIPDMPEYTAEIIAAGDKAFKYRNGDEIPDYNAFFLQFAKCDAVALAALCQEDRDDDSKYDLPEGHTFSEAVLGYYAKLKRWYTKKHLSECAQYLGIADYKFNEKGLEEKLEGHEDDWNACLGALKDIGLPGFQTTYIFGNCVADVVYDPDHPLALGRMSAPYAEWALRKLMEEISNQFPTMSMVRASMMIRDRFFRATGSQQTGGRYHNFPMKPIMERGLHAADLSGSTADDKTIFNTEVAKFPLDQQIRLMYGYMSAVSSEIRIALRNAAGIDSSAGSDEKLRKAHAKLREDKTAYVEMILNRAQNIQQRLALAAQLKFDDADMRKKGVSEYAIFEQNPGLSHVLGLTLALCMWCIHVLSKRMDIKRAKRIVNVPNDQTLGAMLSGTSSDPALLEKLKQRVAEAHSGAGLFASSGVMESVCKQVGARVQLVRADTFQVIDPKLWKLEYEQETGERKVAFSGTQAQKNELEALHENGMLTVDCDGVALVFTDDAANPIFIPQAHMGDELVRFVMRKKPDANVFASTADGVVSARAGELLSIFSHKKDMAAKKPIKLSKKSSHAINDKKWKPAPAAAGAGAAANE